MDSSHLGDQAILVPSLSVDELRFCDTGEMSQRSIGEEALISHPTTLNSSQNGD